MSLYKLDKPDLSSAGIEQILTLIKDPGRLRELVGEVNHPKYLYWDKLRYQPKPEELTAEQFWGVVKFLRRASLNRVESPVKSENSEFFTWQSLPSQEQFLHDVDLRLGGSLGTAHALDETEKRQFISRGVMEEAIASSQLEGANTTRKAAKRLLLEKRQPKNQSEQMIVNNYQTMVAIEQEYRDSKLNKDLLLQFHALLTSGTINDKDVGRFRKDKDEIVVADAADGVIYHIPPREKFLRREIDRLLAYANDELERDTFVHPVIKAIILHFWLGYLHPFTDGNGRLARILFYWYVLRKDYWAFSYLPLSRMIKDAPVQYGMAYVYTEQDDNDLTYFIDYNVRKIRQAQSEFESYTSRKRSENRKLTLAARSEYGLSNRQIQLLRYLYKNAGMTTTIKTQTNVYDIARITAAKELRQLESLGFLTSKKVGREVLFSATSKIGELLG